MKYSIFYIVAVISLLFLSCEKGPGEGGNASIYGKVIIRDFNSSGTFLEQYPAADEDVYIVYGTGNVPSDDMKTGFDGSYEFKYLRPGKYRIYALSEDSTRQTNAVHAELREINISDNDENVEVPTIIIVR